MLLLLALAIRNKLGSPVLFRQQRPGLHGKPFEMLKFRSMREVYDVDGKLVSDNKRLTDFGIWLRSTSLDELPELWNVIKGEMSLVGPRPEQPKIVEELEAQIPFYDVRHLVKPGITGWAQVNYPYGASVEDASRKLEFDLYYMKHYSIFLDFYVALKTLRVVISRGGR